MAAVDNLNPALAALEPSKIGLILNQALRLISEGKPVIMLSIGEPDFETPKEIAEAGKKAIDEGHTKYVPTAGSLELRSAICQKLRDENGIEYSPDQIVVSNGAKQSIVQSILAVCSPGDEVIVPAPYWECYTGMVCLANASPVIVSTSLNDDYLLKPETLSAILTEKSRLLILSSPSNPSGAVYPIHWLIAISKIVAEHPRLLVLSDEIYEKIIYPPAKHRSFASLPGMWKRTLTINGFSKAFSMTGWRLGYLAAPSHFADACLRIQEQMTSCANTIAQKAGVVALRSSSVNNNVRDMVKAFEERRNYVVKRLDAIKGIKLSVPKGAFYALPDVSCYFGCKDQEGMIIKDSESLCKFLLDKAEVALIPGTAFGAPTCVRISYAASVELLKTALDKLEMALSLLSPPSDV
eukprot:TRINITY_DN2551_c0_g1_i1.p1 TRINITY_DN2551_c0_g1~~TRINITY_DN2551_c0_g1_i1.p1  ORF type:complete len:410 (-),score=68.85 TRINITY_DN2551_c0_g1_i1:266-1495(-)